MNVGQNSPEQAPFPPMESDNSSLASLSRGVANSLASQNDVEDLQKLVPSYGRLGIEEIPYQNYEPIPQLAVPPPMDGWGGQAMVEDSLQRFSNRNTQGLDGGGRSTNITRFQPQLVQWQQPDDLARHRLFERNTPASVATNETPFV